MSQEDWNQLIRAAGDAAIELVETQEEFLPFAYVLNVGGELSQIEADFHDAGKLPIEELRLQLRRHAVRGFYRGVAVAEDIQILDPETQMLTKAIRVDIEHKDVEPVSWFLTYRKVRGRYVFGDANGEGVLQPGEPFVFGGEEVDPELV
jgi:hypothetical protein